MQFHVPQFIDVEDKIFGPLTFKQFVYVAGGTGLCIVIYAFVPSQIISFPLMALVAGFSLALAFYRVNNEPFIYIVQAALNYLMNSRLYIWKRREHKEKSPKQAEKEAEQIKALLSSMSNRQKKGSRLSDISFSVDVGDDPKKEPQDPTHVSPNRSPS